jgi:large subunit ribosomal protein L23
MKRIDDVIVRPLLTEKTTRLQEESNQYAFEVGDAATKIEIKQAIESLFGVRVATVRTQVVRGKVKRFGRYHGKRANWKKAIITLPEGEELNVYAGV